MLTSIILAALVVVSVVTFIIQSRDVRKINRAFLTVDEMPDPESRRVKWVEHGGGFSYAQVNFILKNTGNTPAFNISIGRQVGMTADYRPSVGYVGRIYQLNPGDFIVISASYLIDNVAIKELEGFKKILYVTGRLAYNDVFSGKHEQEIFFALRWRNGPDGIPGWDLK